MKRVMSIGLKLFLFILVCFALYLEIFYNGVIHIGALYYFTIQSNLLACVCLLLSIALRQGCKLQRLFRGMSLLAITITGIIYNFVLYKIYLDWNTVGYTYSRTILHVIMPVGFFLDWVLFDKHGRLQWTDLWVWLIYPIIYAFCSIYMSLRDSTSLYFFFNIQSGFHIMVKWLVILLFSLLLIGFSYVGLDRYLGLKNKNENTNFTR